jgi:hypothetical protein
MSSSRCGVRPRRTIHVDVNKYGSAGPNPRSRGRSSLSLIRPPITRHLTAEGGAYAESGTRPEELVG